MMSEEKKASSELEFITVDPGDAGVSPASVKAPAAGRTEDGDALLASMRKTVTNAKHPGLALFVYLFGSILFSSYVFIFVVCILLLAFDFWTVKNVAGRLLVGLRWWNRINDDGSSEWIFESHEDLAEIDARDAQVFWVGLYGAPVVWTLLLVVAVLKLNVQWALIVIVALMLSAANIVGYTKCKKDASQKMRSLMSHGALGALSTSAGSSLLSTLGGLALSGAAPTTRGKQQPSAGSGAASVTV